MLPQLWKPVTWNPPRQDQPGPGGRGLLRLGLGCGRSPLQDASSPTEGWGSQTLSQLSRPVRRKG